MAALNMAKPKATDLGEDVPRKETRIIDRPTDQIINHSPTPAGPILLECPLIKLQEGLWIAYQSPCPRKFSVRVN